MASVSTHTHAPALNWHVDGNDDGNKVYNGIHCWPKCTVKYI